MDSIENQRNKTRARLEERRNAILMGLAPQLTPEFLKTLADVARAIGIEGERDDGPLLNVAEVFRVAGVEPPDLELFHAWTQLPEMMQTAPITTYNLQGEIA